MWTEEQFPNLEPEAAAFLAGFHKALDKVLALRDRHRRELPRGIKELSRILTTERSGLREDYLRDPGARSAYLSYFLPWNLYRLMRLLPGLGLELGDGSHVVDLGAGPLTLAIALWGARPDLRSKKLTFHCVDRTKRTMGQGLDLLRAAAGGDPGKWRVHLVHAPMNKGLASIRQRADLLTAVNLLNETPWRRGEPLPDQVADLVQPLLDHLAPDGRALFIEPGTRLGGKLVSLARAASLEHGLRPLAPCPHAQACPMLDEHSRSWCHFNLDASGVPARLRDLSRQAGLEKERASLSFAHLAPASRIVERDLPASRPLPQSAPPRASATYARVLSDPFKLPGRSGPARYACTERGLAILVSRGQDASLRQGTLVEMTWPQSPERDNRSGALIVGIG